ncbi:aldehyde dehydrogenase 22A1-like [Cynara cardunculus var. scolymus]|uniref:aldehyde dehydrogenase 22A1-like n=1 Tax=Cynara cardunculus var. scolymus TaxID=59895 RepID=UPI000D62F270|nr:aldehyde dehydrogenase 22A1-like [Cynara cardunculus var. scolymus]
MPIMKFSSDEEAIMLANDSKYGLGCDVFSSSQRRAKAIASQIHCGVAAIDDFESTYMCQAWQKKLQMLHHRLKTASCWASSETLYNRIRQLHPFFILSEIDHPSRAFLSVPMGCYFLYRG